MEQHSLGQPQPVKIFGILHIVFGAFGSISLIWTAIVLAMGNPAQKLTPPTPELTAQFESQEALQAQMMPITLVSTVIAIIVTVLIITAGIKLLKKRASGLKWSNRYAWTSLAVKGISLVLTLLYTLPVVADATEASLPASMPISPRQLIMITTVLGTLLSCIYPILTLALLNRPKIKSWFAAQAD
ncbi:hypothetical protein [Luteolibacter algae]